MKTHHLIIAAFTFAFFTGGFAAVARAETPAGKASPADKMQPYRALADEVVAAFKAGDKDKAVAKAAELEKSFDAGTADWKAKDATNWKIADKAMDALIKPFTKNKPLEAGKVQAAHDDFVEKLKLATP